MHENLANEVTLLVDTNLFLECSSLTKLPWHELGYASVELIVSRPVQQELDNHKKKKSGRTFKRALEATKLIRDLVTSGQSKRVVRDSGPRVILSIMPASPIQPDLNEQLDPASNDDAIILRMLQYQRDNETANVSLFTHDTGPMATAVSIGAPFIPIPDTWLMREQHDTATKEIKKLKTELQQLRSQEPLFDIKVLDKNGVKISRLDIEVSDYEALTCEQVYVLIEDIRQKFPMAIEFGTAASASDEDIQKFQQESYPEWISTCRAYLEALHGRLNARAFWPEIDFVIGTSGTRPALRSSVRFVAKGSIQIFWSKNSDTDDDSITEHTIEAVELPNPPLPPRGTWRGKTPNSPAAIAQRVAQLRQHIPATRFPSLELDLTLVRRLTPNDPDSFYWKHGRPTMPTSAAELTCENWRHNVVDEHFKFRVTTSASANISGAIQCEIHAENLSDPVSITLPVKIERTAKSTFDHAQNLVGDLHARWSGTQPPE
jgi:hypothetical protein